MRLRTPDSFSDALTQIVAVVGAPRMAHALGLKDPSRIYKATNEGEAGYSQLSLDQAVIIAAQFRNATGEVDPISRSWKAQLDQLTHDVPEDNCSLQRRLAMVHQQASELTAEVLKAECPDSEGGSKKTRNEAMRIAHETNDVINELEALKRKVLGDVGLDPFAYPVRQSAIAANDKPEVA